MKHLRGEVGLVDHRVDAAGSAPVPHELAALDLRGCIEALSVQFLYLAARGLLLRHVDTRDSPVKFLDRLQAAAPQARVLCGHYSSEFSLSFETGAIALQKRSSQRLRARLRP